MYSMVSTKILILSNPAAEEPAIRELTFSVDEGGRHMPSGSFICEALDWYLEDREA